MNKQNGGYSFTDAALRLLIWLMFALILIVNRSTIADLEDIDPTFRGHIIFAECKQEFDILCRKQDKLRCNSYYMPGNRMFINIRDDFICWNVRDGRCEKRIDIFAARSKIDSSFTNGFADYDIDERKRFRLSITRPFNLNRQEMYITFMEIPARPAGSVELVIWHGACRVLSHREGSQIR